MIVCDYCGQPLGKALSFNDELDLRAMHFYYNKCPNFYNPERDSEDLEQRYQQWVERTPQDARPNINSQLDK